MHLPWYFRREYQGITDYSQCGVLLESKAVRNLFYPSPQGDEGYSHYMQPLHESLPDHRTPRETKATYNILPALVIFLLGKSMSGHHQSSSLSVALHTQVCQSKKQ